MKREIDLNQESFFQRYQVVKCVLLILLLVVIFGVLRYAYADKLQELRLEKVAQMYDENLPYLLLILIAVAVVFITINSVKNCYQIVCFKRQEKCTFREAKTMNDDFNLMAKRLVNLRTVFKRIRADYDEMFPRVSFTMSKRMVVITIAKNHWFNKEAIQKNMDFFKSVCKLPFYKMEEDYSKFVLYFTNEQEIIAYLDFQKWLVKDKVLFGFSNGQPIYWDYNEVPHFLGIGPTGSGKSNLERVLIDSMTYCGFKIEMIDGKRVELAPYRKAGYTVHTSDFLPVFKRFYEIMNNRYEMMEEKGVIDYREVNLQPYALFIDEYKSVFNKFLKKALKDAPRSEYEEAVFYAGEILAQGRAAGIHLVSFTQDPKADTIDTSLRNNFNLRFLLGYVTEPQNYDMMFGGGYRNLEKQDKGSGYYSALSEPQVVQIPLHPSKIIGKNI